MTTGRPEAGGDAGLAESLAKISLFLVVLTPVILVPHYLFPFVTTRNLAFRVCVELAFGAVLYRGLSVQRVSRAGDNILKMLVAFVAAAAISAVAGVSLWRSLFGDFERMGGVWAWLHLALFYFLLRVVFTQRDWQLFLRAAVLVSDAVVLWGGATVLPASVRNPAFIMGLDSGSTVGNPGLLGGYLLFGFWIACYLAVSETRRQWTLFSIVSAALALAGMLASTNRSSMLGLFAGAVAAAAIFAAVKKNPRLARRAFAGVAISITLLVGAGYVAYLKTGPLTAFGNRWSALQVAPNKDRLIEWKIALEGFADRPIFGYGIENHEVVASAHFDPRLYGLNAGGVFDRAHNAWLELLGTTGLLGTAAMLALWCAVFVTLRNAARTARMSAWESAIWGGLSVAYAVYLCFWFFDINSALLWIATLAFIASRGLGRLDVVPAQPSRSWMLAAMEALVALAIYFHGVVPLRAAHDLSAALERGNPEEKLADFITVMDSPAPQTLQTFPLYRRFLTALTITAGTSPRSPASAKELDLAFRRGFYASKVTVSRDPYNDREYLEQARLYFVAGLFYRDPAYARDAATIVRRAIRLSPKRAENRVFLFSVLLSLGDSGGAVAQLDTARRYAPIYAPAYFLSGKFANARGQTDSASVLLLRALTLGYIGTPDVYLSVQRALERKMRPAESATLGKTYLEMKFGRLNRWPRMPPERRPRLARDDSAVASHLPIAFLKAGQPGPALAAAEAFGAVVPMAGPLVAAFAADVNRGRGDLWVGRDALAPAPATR